MSVELTRDEVLDTFERWLDEHTYPLAFYTVRGAWSDKSDSPFISVEMVPADENAYVLATADKRQVSDAA